MSSRTTSSAWVKGVVDMFDAAGLDSAAFLAAAEISPEILSDPDARAPTEKMSRLWRAAAEMTGDPAIGLVHPQVPKPGNFDIVGYAMLSSQTLRAALHSFARHLRLVSDAAEIRMDESEAEVRVRLTLFGGREPIPRQRMEFDLLTVLTFCRWVSGRPITPLALHLESPAPADRAPYVAAFQCPIVFGADFNGLVLEPADLDAPLPAHNPQIAGLHDRLIEQRLALFDGGGLAMRVRDAIARLIATGETRRERVAQWLDISDRTLQRRLREENTSFEKLLESTRCDLARHYLAQQHLSLAEVAYLLGFADQSTFFRACKRWFQASPLQFRQRLSEAANGSGAATDGREVAPAPPPISAGR